MKPTLVLTLCLSGCLLAGCATTSRVSKVSSFPLPSSDTPFTRKVLDNGLVLLVKEIHTAPIISLRAYVRTGSATEEPFIGSGVSHVVEHMLFKGTETRKVGEIEKEIRSYGGDFNAFTTTDLTAFSIIVDRSHFKEALSVLADALMHSSFEPEEFQREKEVVLKEVRMNRDDPSRRIHSLLWETAYQSHPYRHPVIGHESLLSRLTRDQVYQFYRTVYVPNNIVLVLAGDLDREEAVQEAEKIFQPFERTLFQTPVSLPEPPQRGRRFAREEADVELTRLMLGYHTVSVSHEDLYPLDVLAILLGQGESSRLETVLRKGRQLVYAISASNQTPKDPGLFVISALLDEGKLSDAKAAIEEEILRFKDHPVSGTDLEKAKRQVLADFVFGRETTEGEAADLAENEIYVGNPLFSQTYVQEISKVTAESVQRVARRYLQTENQTEVLLVPKKKQEEALSPRETVSNPPVTPVRLPNGLTVLLRRDTTHPIVFFQISFLGGLRAEQEKTQGISRFVSELVLKGTARWSEKELSEWLDQKGASLGTFSGQNSFGVQLKVLSSDTWEALDRLQEIVSSPSFPLEEIEKEKTRTLALIRAQEDQIFTVASNKLRQLVYERHPYRFNELGSDETISQLSREEILSFYEKARVAPQMVIAVFGDFDIDRMRRELEKRFATLPAQTHPITPPQEPAQTSPRALTEERPKVQAVLMVGYPICPLTHPDRPAFEVLSQYLSGGGGKLFFEIRDKKGQAYTLGAYPVWGLDPGFYLFYVGTTKEEVEFVEKRLFEIIRKLQEGVPDAEEVDLAKKSLAGMHRVSLQTNTALAFESSLDALYGLGYDAYLHDEEEIEKVTPEDLSRIANTYFRSETVSIVRILPKETSP